MRCRACDDLIVGTSLAGILVLSLIAKLEHGAITCTASSGFPVWKPDSIRFNYGEMSLKKQGLSDRVSTNYLVSNILYTRAV